MIVEEIGDFFMACLDGNGERGLAILVLRVHIRALLDQQFSDCRVAIASRIVQRRLAVFVLPIHIRSFFDQKLRHSRMAVLSCDVQWRQAQYAAPCIHIGAPQKKALHCKQIALARSMVQTLVLLCHDVDGQNGANSNKNHERSDDCQRNADAREPSRARGFCASRFVHCFTVSYRGSVTRIKTKSKPRKRYVLLSLLVVPLAGRGNVIALPTAVLSGARACAPGTACAHVVLLFQYL